MEIDIEKELYSIGWITGRTVSMSALVEGKHRTQGQSNSRQHLIHSDSQYRAWRETI